MPKTRQIIRPHIRLQKLQRDVRKQFGTYKTTYLARVDGSVRLPGGLFWVHDANGVDANGNTVYGAPRKMPMLPGAAIIPRPNTRVDVVTVSGVDYIARTNAAELDRMGIDAHQSNTFDPAAQFKVIEQVSNLQGFKTPGASSTHIVGSIYKKPDGTYDVFRTAGAYDFVTANIPSTDMQVVVCQWLDTDTNTITATVSSEISRDTDLKHGDNIADTMMLINECVAAAPTNHIGINAWRVYDDTTIATLSENNKLADLRGIVGTRSTTNQLDITALTETTTIDGAADFLVIYDASATANRKVKPDNLPGGGGTGDYLLFTHEEAANTNGGTATAGSRQTRSLNYKRHDTGTNGSIIELAFTSGGTYEVVAGNTITGATSSATATVFDVVLTSGSWAGGDAAGTLWLNDQTGTFSAENLNVGANTNVATIAGNSTSTNYRFRLKAGTYRLTGDFQFYDTGGIQMWLYNVTDSADEFYSHSGYTSSAGTAAIALPIRGRITIAANKTFRFEYQCSATSSTTDGQGVKNNFAATEQYATVELIKE